MKTSTSIPFLWLIYILSIELGIEIVHYVDSLIEVQRSLDTSSIKVEDNQVAFKQVPRQL